MEENRVGSTGEDVGESMEENMSVSMEENMSAYLRQLITERYSRHTYRPGDDWGAWRTSFRDSLRLLLGGFPSQPAELEPVVKERVQCDGYVRERVEITTYAGLRMPMYILIPGEIDQWQVVKEVNKSLPAIVACHGHGYGSKEISGLEPDGSARTGEAGLHKDFAIALVRKGFVVAAPELLGFGERRFSVDAMTGPQSNSCFRLAVQLMMVGQNLAGHRVYETIRVIDYLQTRLEVAAEQIGSMGISGGGLVTTFTAALDDRIQAAVVSGYANTFQRSILDRNHCLDNYIPGMLLESDMPDVIGLIAPRPLLIESGSEDLVFPRTGAEEALVQLKLIYDAAGAGELLKADLFVGGHEISGAQAYDWLERVL